LCEVTNFLQKKYSTYYALEAIKDMVNAGDTFILLPSDYQLHDIARAFKSD